LASDELRFWNREAGLMERTSPFTLSRPGDPIELQEVFVYFASKFERLRDPRSIAEACISDQDVQSLCRWFSALYGKPRNWCQRDWQESLIDGQTASSREMFGSLFLILAAELCREKSSEDSVWPAVVDVLKADRVSFSKLFVAGQPTELCKSAMAAGARRLRLRNLIDRSGTQEYFDTLKLQFGFTFKGAKSRLVDWLDGLPTPIAVSILRSAHPEFVDLGSDSFKSTWSALSEVRRGRISVRTAVETLRGSPWIRRDWLDELISLVVNSPRRYAAPSSVDTEARAVEAVCEPMLRWQYPSKPRLFLRLNEDLLLKQFNDADAVVFAVDGRVVARWTAQSQGAWAGPRAIPCEPESMKERPSLKPKLLSATTDQGEPLLEVDLREELGIGEPLLLFDLQNGNPICLEHRLETHKEYAFVCDTDLTVEGAQHFLSLPGCSAFYLMPPVSPSLRVVSEGSLYWQPNVYARTSQEALQVFVAAQEDSVVEIGRAIPLEVVGLPPSTHSAVLIVGGIRYELARGLSEERIWITNIAVPISLALALGEERIRIKFSCGTGSRTVAPKIRLRLRGIAGIDVNRSAGEAVYSWRLLDRKRPLNLAGGAGRAKLFAPVRHSQIFEGPKLVSKSTARSIDFRDLYGWGWPLSIKADPGLNTILVDSVDDRGCVAVYVKELFGKPIHKVWLRNPIEPSTKHRIRSWRLLNETAKVVCGNDIVSESANNIWGFPNPGAISAIAIEYDGACLGSHIDLQLVSSALEEPLAATFSLLRWLKTPVLSLTLENLMQRAVFKAPWAFVRGWMHCEQNDLHFRQSDPGADLVLRWFLWNYKESREDRLERIATEVTGIRADGSLEQFIALMSSTAEICPSLSYGLAKAKLRSKADALVFQVLTQLLRLPSAATLQWCDEALRMLTQEVASLVQSNPASLEQMMAAFGDYLDNRESGYRRNERILREVGELSKGRAFISASLLARALRTRRA
jgi:hypothetical protein